jgi:hypothetical protein
MATPSPSWLPSYADMLRDWLAQGTSVRLLLSGTSMRPSIDDGATIVVAPVVVASMSAGDVALYEDAGRLVCHRVVSRRRAGHEDLLLLAGDGVRLPPVWIRGSAVVGRVAAVEQNGRVRRLDGRGARALSRLPVARAWIRWRLPSVLRALQRAMPSPRIA